KLLPHLGHYYSFSPLWTRLCDLSSELLLKAFAQSGHLYGLSPVWIR
ncbi:hypothetical protein Anapl_16071, partial [Anas platyrhynchos]